jgi:hypothetical protein
MPGGPTRVVKADSNISEDEAKSVYTESFSFRRAKCLDDVEAVWPLCKVIDEIEMERDFGQFLMTSSKTGRARGLVEV